MYLEGYLGRRPLARRRAQARCTTNRVWAYPTYKENEMERIGALNGMRWLVLSLVFQVGYTSAGAAQEIHEATSSIQRTLPPKASLHYWTGRIEQDTTWHDTVYVGGDVTIASGATLTLAPDTKVHFLPYHDDTQGGLDSTRTELIVEGRLHAQAEGIVFCSTNAASLGADWYGIVVKRGGLADVSNATIRDGLRCLYKMGGRVAMDHVAFANCGTPTTQSLSQRVDSLTVKKRHPPFDDIEDGGLRFLAKMAAGTVSGIVFTVIGFGGVGEVLSDGSYSDGGLGAAGFFLWGAAIGTSVGFPIGVTSVDPYDSLPMTLLAGVIPGAVGTGLVWAGNETGFKVAYVGPVISSLIASELSRKPPQDRRVSFVLSPTINGGFSAVTTLRF